MLQAITINQTINKRSLRMITSKIFRFRTTSTILVGTFYRTAKFKNNDKTEQEQMLSTSSTTAAGGAGAAVSTHYNVDVAIVGGGLAGLMIANELEKKQQEQQHQSYKLFEARDILGGRLVNDNGPTDDIDLGGAWFWPPEQELVSGLVQELDIGTFEQAPRHPFMSTRRFDGGAVQLIRKLYQRIPDHNVVMNSPIVKCEQIVTSSESEEKSELCEASSSLSSSFGSKKIKLQTSNNSVICLVISFCIPPKLITKHITFDPPLSAAKQRAMKESNTWMAGVTKVALTYSKPFWNANYEFQNLIGRLPGPAFQLYDSSTDKVSALTAFTLATQPGTIDNTDEDNVNLAKKVAAQVSQSFQLLGQTENAQNAQSFEKFYIQRWPLEKYISEETYPKNIQPHPYPVKALSTVEWNGLLLFGGTETDDSSPGVMEGAIGSAIRCVEQLSKVIEENDEAKSN